MELDILLRGQSNAGFFDQWGGSQALKNDLQAYLGFDGVTNKINLIGNSTPDAQGNVTIMGSTSLLPTLDPNGPHWLDETTVNGSTVYSDDKLEDGLLAHLAALPADVKAAPTAVIWMHNEGDGDWPGQTTQNWVGGVEYDAAQVRAVLGQTAVTVPYLFTDIIPFDSDNAASLQAIKLGMEQLSANPAFNATISTHTGDLNMDNPVNGLPDGRVIYGGPHVDQTDINVLAGRIARTLIDTFAQYALPGSPLAMAGGHLDDVGPQAVSANPVSGSPYQLVVSTQTAVGATGLTPLTPGAAQGLGWTVQQGGVVVEAIAAHLTSNNRLVLTFSAPITSDGTATLYYGYGTGRIAAGADTHTGTGYPGTGPSSPGEGNSIYDDTGEPIWASASGVGVANQGVALPLEHAKASYAEVVLGGNLVIADQTPGGETALTTAPGTQIMFSDGLYDYDASGKSAELARLYQAGLGRAPEQAAFQYFQNASVTAATIAGNIPGSMEFLSQHPATLDHAYIGIVYGNAVGHAPTPDELATYVAQLASGSSRASVLLQIADSAEARIHNEANYADPLVNQVQTLYHAELGRATDTVGLSGWTDQLTHGLTTSQLAATIATSQEFQALHSGQSDAGYITSLYVGALGRTPGAPEVAPWVSYLQGGASRSDAALNIASSPEAMFDNSPETGQGLVHIIPG